MTRARKNTRRGGDDDESSESNNEEDGQLENNDETGTNEVLTQTVARRNQKPFKKIQIKKSTGQCRSE